MSAPQETQLQFMLSELRTRVLIMCAAVEEAVANACAALCERDAKTAYAVIDADCAIDAMENEVDEMALSLMARLQPVARDLRFVVSALRMVIDLERIGDEASAIAERALLLTETPASKVFETMRQMAVVAQRSLHDAVQAFQEENVPLALSVCRDKDEIMRLEVRLLQELIKDHACVGKEIEAASWPFLHAVHVAHSLSRIFGRASNIAEHCYFMKQGVSIKHKKCSFTENP